jgi:hypothetical protein
MLTFSPLSLEFDTSSNNKDLKNTEIKSMMNIDHQQNQNEEFNRESVFSKTIFLFLKL